MKKIIKQKTKEEQSINILKQVARRVEGASVDIHSLKFDVKAMKLNMGFIQSDFAIMKVGVERMREELKGAEDRLGKRITHVADLITISMDQKMRRAEKRIRQIERIQQTA